VERTGNCNDHSNGRCFLVAAFGAAGLFVAALGLLKEGGEDAGEGDEETDNEEAETHRAPEGDVARGAGLLGDVGVGDAAGDEAEEDERAGEDIEVASHADGSILRRAGPLGRLERGHKIWLRRCLVVDQIENEWNSAKGGVGPLKHFL
jgi:hypothetical protein